MEVRFSHTLSNTGVIQKGLPLRFCGAGATKSANVRMMRDDARLETRREYQAAVKIYSVPEPRQLALLSGTVQLTSTSRFLFFNSSFQTLPVLLNRV